MLQFRSNGDEQSIIDKTAFLEASKIDRSSSGLFIEICEPFHDMASKGCPREVHPIIRTLRKDNLIKPSSRNTYLHKRSAVEWLKITISMDHNNMDFVKLKCFQNPRTTLFLSSCISKTYGRC